MTLFSHFFIDNSLLSSFDCNEICYKNSVFVHVEIFNAAQTG